MIMGKKLILLWTAFARTDIFMYLFGTFDMRSSTVVAIRVLGLKSSSDHVNNQFVLKNETIASGITC